MNEDASKPASSSPLAATGRSLLSRFASPLRSRTRNLTDFYIRAQEPHRHYSPGDIVKGAVVLTVVKPIRITHLTVALHGFVKVYKNRNTPTDNNSTEPALAPGTSFRKSQYLGNGQASLFQDEVILCGEGRLEPGIYEFEFELEFPSKGLPSSIDFERGTISYMIRSTITRPTSIAATSSCDAKVNLVETVDIGPMHAPKPRIISLEPIAKRSKKAKKSKGKVDIDSTVPENTSDSVLSTTPRSPVQTDSTSPRVSGDHSSLPQSPNNFDGQSEGSGGSVVSSSTGISFRFAPAPSSNSNRDSQGDRSSAFANNKTITATIELLRAGCLPGDSIPLRISIQHTKRIKSMHGIIITLYRQARIDSAPPLSMFTDIKGKAAEKLKHEEYYPKSKTGLGGLSLSSAGSSSVFRKDLSQTFAPIIIDPVSLSTVVNSSIRVPEDAFPTITGVPGQMISFKYHIEVVIDLGGKLAGTSRHLPKLGMTSVPPNFTTNHQHLGREDASPAMLATWGGSIVDTDHIRREKSVVACLFELVVGTKDSGRVRGQNNSTSRNSNAGHRTQSARTLTFQDERPEEEVVSFGGHDENHHNGFDESEEYQHDPSHFEEDYDYGYHQEDSANATSYPSHISHVPQYIPPPNVPLDENLNEKERVRRAEERLLPSQPDQEGGASSSSNQFIPSAPPNLGNDTHIPGESSQMTYGTEETLIHASRNPTASHFPAILEGSSEAQSISNIPDDKQELERRRLMAEASSPADFPDDHENAGEGPSFAGHDEPSAPVLDEEEGDSRSQDHILGLPSGSGGQEHENLPKYVR